MKHLGTSLGRGVCLTLREEVRLTWNELAPVVTSLLIAADALLLAMWVARSGWIGWN